MMRLLVAANPEAVAIRAAELATHNLSQVINARTEASWLLSGGSAPMLAYDLIARDYQAKLDWSKVWVAIGDERCVELSSPEANWNQISPVLLAKLPIPETQRLKPKFDQAPDLAAEDYSAQLLKLPGSSNDTISLDLVWLGIGEDGHTLSLFPGQTAIDNQSLVAAVHNSPKPPPDRISLTLNALTKVAGCLVVAVGKAKAGIVAGIKAEDQSLPIVKVISFIENHGGQVTLLVDQPAAAQLN